MSKHCCCCHDDCDEELEKKECEEEEEEEKHNKLLNIITFSFGLICLVVGFILQKTDTSYSEITWTLFGDTNFYKSQSFVSFILYTIGYIPLLIVCIRNSIDEIKEGEIINEFTLMIIATIGAYAINEYPECLFVLLFSIIGQFLEGYATSKSKQSIKKLVNSMPLYAHYVNEDGSITEKEPEELEIGNLIEIRPGEKIPVDGIIVKGKTSLDLSSLNGESLPKDVEENEYVYSGSVNLNSLITIKVLKEFKDSTLSKILDLVAKQQKSKAKSERFITKFAKFYTPAVILIAIGTFLVGFGLSSWQWNPGGQESLYRALSVLLISCPCALVISVPIAFFAGIGSGSKNGILIKGSIALENLAKTDTFLFDKTGTLTQGNFTLQNEVDPKLLQIAASLESKSTHPLAKALCEANKEEYLDVSQFENVPGYGVKGIVEGKEYLIGTKEFSLNNNVDNFEEVVTPYKVLYLSEANNKMIAYFIVADQVKDGVKESFEALRDNKAKQLSILSGDEAKIVEKVSQEIGADQHYGGLLPDQKLEQIKKLQEEKHTVAFVGDGINDSPSLLASDVGIAMGALGSDAAIEASDIVIMDDDIRKVAEAKRLSKKTLFIVKLCITIAILLKIAFMVLVMTNVLGQWAMIVSSISDTGVMVVCVLIAITMMFYKPKYIKTA